MEGVTSNIVLRQSWNNLIDLPSNLASLLYNANVTPQEVIVELVSQHKQKSYVGWTGMISSGPRKIGIDPIFAHSLNLSEKQLVTINVKIKNFKTSKVYLEPELSSDWELVELHAAHIESKLIEQSRCVALNQILVIYPTKTSSVRLQVKDIGSNSFQYALIDPFAEISIAPKLREKNQSKGTKSIKSGKSNRSSSESHSEDKNRLLSVLKRAISLPSPQFEGIVSKDGKYCYELYGRMEEFKHFPEYVSVSLFPGPTSKLLRPPSSQDVNQRDNKTNSELQKIATSIIESRSIVARLVEFDGIPGNNVGLSEGLAIALSAEKQVGFKVVIKPAGKHLSKRPSTLIIHPYVTKTVKKDNIQLNSIPSKKVRSSLALRFSDFFFKEQLLQKGPISNFSKIAINSDNLPEGGLLVFKRSDDLTAWIKPINAKSPLPKIEIGEDLLRPASFIQNCEEKYTPEPVYGIQIQLDKLLAHMSTFRNSGVMLFGATGSGKTSVLKWLARSLELNTGKFTKYIACENTMNESVETLCMNVSKWLNEAVWHEPSVLILDNLDQLMSAEAENTDSTTSNQLSEYFISLLQKIHSQNSTNVSLIVSGLSKESFSKILTQSHVIEEYVHLTTPNKSTRAAILSQYFSSILNCRLNFDLMDIVSETEGYLPNDLKLLGDRIYCEMVSRENLSVSSSLSGNQYKIYKSDFEKALNGFRPSSLRKVKLEKSSTKWEDVGGLFDAKRLLLETLEWPTKYAPIFSSCPLRLRSGILLYGYPGCGKTLLASAIANQCGLNFISIKGPEILNKYIGASEQSVRELFDRAQSAKPCILFFDEFDSIAPKRGHDSTGVTDRVVNQMLTQMDGAEGLDGVYVLAATSRPDLIDSALLRPGRLDKSIICDMPNLIDRLNILESVLVKMNLTDDVSLQEIALQTEGFSGADIQGLGYNAYLKAVHEKLTQDETNRNSSDSSNQTFDFFQLKADKLKNKKMTATEKVILLQQIENLFLRDRHVQEESKCNGIPVKSKVFVNRGHFLESLKETKPSISATEKLKLQRIYTEFLTGRDGNMPDGSTSNDIGGRTTLM